ncbi:MAG: IS5 family transposase [Burkholderiales bacterium]|nr:IS5 family transposase [Opitutaceae bacterium]
MARAKLGYRFPEELWTRLEPLIPPHANPHPRGGGRPRRADRDCADGIFFVLRTGCQWEALDTTGLCPHSTAHDRFQEWVEAGVWQKLWAALLEHYDEVRGLDWRWLSVDGSQGKAPLASVAEHGGPNPTDRGKRGVKRSVVTEAAGVPVGIVVAGANRNDHLLLAATLDAIVVPRPAPSAEAPQGLCLDKGYDYASTREVAAARGLTLHLRTRGEEALAQREHPGGKARRWVVERAHSWLHRFRRILVRWEKKAVNYAAMLHLAAATIVAGQAGIFG